MQQRNWFLFNKSFTPFERSGRVYFHTLLVCQKWYTNVCVGNIVSVYDSSSLQGQWKLAEVAMANPGNDGKVRDVTLLYNYRSPGTSYSEQQHVLINRSAHKLV